MKGVVPSAVTSIVMVLPGTKMRFWSALRKGAVARPRNPRARAATDFTKAWAMEGPERKVRMFTGV